MSKNVKIFLSIVGIVLFAIGISLNNFGLERHNPTDRTVTLLDVGVTIESIKSNKISSINGLFLDKSTGFSFLSPVDINTLSQFKAGANQELNMVRSFSLDTVNGNDLGRFLMFLGIVSCFFGGTFICVVVQYTMDEKADRKKKELNNHVPTST